MTLFKSLLCCALLAGAPAMVCAVDAAPAAAVAPSFNVLVFSKTNGFRHSDAIAAGVPFFKKMGELHGFAVDATEDPAVFTEDSLKKYQAIVLLNTTGEFTAEKPGKGADKEQKAKIIADSLARQTAFKNYVANGGAIVGLHSATDCFHEGTWSVAGRARWSEFQKIIGGAFLNHPKHQTCTLEIVDKDNPATAFLITKNGAPEWKVYDEWYSFKYLQRDNHVLMTLDTKTGKGHQTCVYEGGEKATTHPFVWTREYGKGKVFYTSRGHYGTAFAEPEYAQHVIAGLFQVVGKTVPTVDPATLPPVKGAKKR